jgi:hypothetical protein
MFAFNTFILNAQKYVSINVDNDLYLGTDRYYSSGIFIEYGKISTPRTVNNKSKGFTSIQWTLGQEITTPSYRYSKEITKLDYPYNGWLYIQFKKENFKSLWSGFSYGFQFGTTGSEESLAKQMQNFYHTYFLNLPKLSWINPQPQAFHLNFFTNYFKGFKLCKNLNLVSNPKLMLGTYNTFLSTRLGFQYGKTKHYSFFNNSFTTNNNDISFYLGTHLTYSFHNYSFSGSLFRENSSFINYPKKLNKKIELGFVTQNDKWKITSMFVSASNDFDIQRYKSHKYVTIIISRFF